MYYIDLFINKTSVIHSAGFHVSPSSPQLNSGNIKVLTYPCSPYLIYHVMKSTSVVVLESDY